LDKEQKFYYYLGMESKNPTPTLPEGEGVNLDCFPEGEGVNLDCFPEGEGVSRDFPPLMGRD
jgi:hypothetical protein